MNTLNRVGRAIRGNPEGLLLVGASLALLLRHTGVGTAYRTVSASGIHRSGRDSYADDESNKGFREKVSAATDDAHDYVAGSASALAEKASEYTQAASRKTRDAAESAYQSVEGVINAHPLTIAVAGAAAGCLLAAVFPYTRFERDMPGPIGRRAAEAVSEADARLKSMAAEAGYSKDDGPHQMTGNERTTTGATNAPNKVVGTGDLEPTHTQRQSISNNENH